MVILDEKTIAYLPPPPPYVAAGQAQPPPFPAHAHRPHPRPTLATLPPHLLLNIVYATFRDLPPGAPDEPRRERQRRVLYWLSTALRLVDRALYSACMHVLRSTYMPAYESLIRAPFTSDPFPLTALPAPAAPTPLTPLTPTTPTPLYTAYPSAPTPAPAPPAPIHSLQRETAVLDLFIALKVREDVWADASEFHLERDEALRDLFDLMQPRARLEDLVRVYGVRDGVVSVRSSPASSRSGSSSNLGTATAKGKARALPPLPFSALSIALAPRRAGVVMAAGGRKRTLVEVARARDEPLEVAARRLVRELRAWVAAGGTAGGPR